MAKKAKTIDGFQRRTRNNRGTLGFNDIKPSNRQRQAMKEMVLKKHQEATEDFLRPVGTFEFDVDSDALEREQEQFSGKKTKAAKAQAKKARKKAKKPWSKKKKIIVGILSTLGVLLAAAAVIFLIWGNDILGRLTNGGANLWDAIGALNSNVRLKTDKNGRTNVLVMGTSGYDMGGSGHDGAQLTDSIMVISLDQDTKDVAMISLPRDLKVDGTCTATGKINEVYWCNNQDGNDEKAGADALAEEVEDVLGLSIQYYAHLNWGALVEVVDQIGGVTVTLDEDINDTWTKTYIKSGMATALNGEQALGLARARHGTANGDFSRGNSQQKILMAIQEKVLEDGMSLNEAIGLLNILGDNLRTDLNMDEMKTAISIGKDLKLSDVRQIPLVDLDDGTSLMVNANIGGISYVIPAAGAHKYSQIHKYITKMLSSDPAVREDANIMVLNGSGEAGKAAKARESLEKKGFTVGAIDDAPAGTYSKRYYLYDLTDKYAGTKAALEKKYKVTAKSKNKLPAGINASGFDFVLIIGTGK